MLDLFRGIGGFHEGFKRAGNAVTVDVVQAVATIIKEKELL